jgi:hypothetical protein
MTRMEWWIGVGLIVVAILCHAAVPRFELHLLPEGGGIFRLDRWTGRVEITNDLKGTPWLRVYTPGTSPEDDTTRRVLELLDKSESKK